MKDYENIANNIIKKIYPFLVLDLKSYYKQEFENKTIIELGTGPGHIIEELLKNKFKHIYGIDISLEMLIKAQKRNISNNKLQLINANVEKIPLKDESIDIIISRGSIFFWKNLEKALRELFRIFKDYGLIFI